MQSIPVTGPLQLGSPFSIDALRCQATSPRVHLPEASPTPSVSRPEAGLPSGCQVYWCVCVPQTQPGLHGVSIRGKAG